MDLTPAAPTDVPLDEHQFDQARRLEEEERTLNIEAARRANVEEPLFDGADRRICRGCYEPLSHERLAVQPNAARCTECQSLKEKWNQ